ncbi:MAG: DUF429 domain-containing protein [Acidobacteria bacterium]|nr:DUF429 domain-containing protein [Acidobacteriota bacterium]
MAVFIGVDLGWYGKPTGLASLRADGGRLRLAAIDRIESRAEILEWIGRQAGDEDAVAGVDAPLVIGNASGIREAERQLNRDFRRYDAGCHAANLGMKFAGRVMEFSRLLGELGFAHGADMAAGEGGRFQIEVHPHAAVVSLFDLDRIVKYKRGRRADRARELERLRGLMLERLAGCDPPLDDAELPSIPAVGALKPAEDRIDAVMCAYVAAYWHRWGRERNTVYGTAEAGYIVVPHRRGGPAVTPPRPS